MQTLNIKRLENHRGLSKNRKRERERAHDWESDKHGLNKTVLNITKYVENQKI